MVGAGRARAHDSVRDGQAGFVSRGRGCRVDGQLGLDCRAVFGHGLDRGDIHVRVARCKFEKNIFLFSSLVLLFLVPVFRPTVGTYANERGGSSRSWCSAVLCCAAPLTVKPGSSSAFWPVQKFLP